MVGSMIIRTVFDAITINLHYFVLVIKFSLYLQKVLSIPPLRIYYLLTGFICKAYSIYFWLFFVFHLIAIFFQNFPSNVVVWKGHSKLFRRTFKGHMFIHIANSNLVISLTLPIQPLSFHSNIVNTLTLFFKERSKNFISDSNHNLG